MECLIPHPAPYRRLSVHLPLRIIVSETTAPPQIEYHVVYYRPGQWGNQQRLAWYYKSPVDEKQIYLKLFFSVDRDVLTSFIRGSVFLLFFYSLTAENHILIKLNPYTPPTAQTLHWCQWKKVTHTLQASITALLSIYQNIFTFYMWSSVI